MIWITHRQPSTRRTAASPPPAGQPASRMHGLLACLLLTLLNGCSSLAGRDGSPEASVAPVATQKSVHLTYRTDSGRLNQMASEPLQNESDGEGRSVTTPVPRFTTSTLTIEHPHPEGMKGYARVTARFESKTDEEENAGTLWSLISGKDSSDDSVRPQFREVWYADIRDWQLASLVEGLKKKNFFRRVKVIGSEADLRVEINDRTMAKEFPAIAELDTLLVTIRQEGRRASAPATTPSSPAPPEQTASSASGFPPQPKQPVTGQPAPATAENVSSAPDPFRLFNRAPQNPDEHAARSVNAAPRRFESTFGRF